MTAANSTIDNEEVHKFAQHAHHWWDTKGPLKTLHDINDTRLEFIVKYSNLAELNVLDVGCGGGILSEALARLGAHVSAIDAEPAAIEAAKSHALSTHLTIDYQCMPIEDYEHSRFDVITCMEMLEHVQNPAWVIEHCERLLKPGGLLFLSTISRTLKAYAGAVIAAEYIFHLLPKQTHDYSKFIKPSELSSMARAVDLHVVDIKGLHYNPLTRKASLSDDVSINYLLAVKKPIN